MAAELKRPSPEALLAKLKVGDKPTLRVYIGVAVLETHGRSETAALAEGLERVPMRHLEYRGVIIEEISLRPSAYLCDLCV
jgi:two-component system sensor histidine kinase KdpD